MKAIQRIGILFFLVVFLFGATGISIFEHICTCQGKTEITIFPEIFDHNSSCCCTDGELELVTPDHVGFCGHEKTDRCKNIKYFIKAAVTPVPVAMNLFVFMGFAIPQLLQFADIFPIRDQQSITFFFPYSSSPPISGQQRIIAFHQPKVPAPHIFLV